MGIEENNFRSCLDCRNHADFREDPDGQDYHPRGGVLGYYLQRQVQDPGQGGHPTRPATSHLRWQATRGWPHPFGLQHPEGVHSSSSAPSPWRRKEAQEEGVHHPKEDQAQARRPSWLSSSTTRSTVTERSSVFAESAQLPTAAPVSSWLLCTTDNTVDVATLPTSSMRLESKAILAGYGWMATDEL